MSEHDQHTSFIKTPKQLIAVVVLAFTVPVLVIAMIASLASQSVDPETRVESAEAIAKRLKPVGEVVIDPNAPAPVPAPAPSQQVAAAAPPAAGGAAPAPATAGGAAKGKAVYEQACFVCHGAGVAGAPKLGDKAAWAPRLKQGLDALHQAALKGKGAMPPKGGNMALSDADVNAAVDFMVGQAK
jgi:cytochrome c5